MPRFLFLTALLAALVIALTAPVHASERTISVQGAGAASAAPDILTVMIGVEVSGKNAAATMRAVNGRAGAVLYVARGLGVEPKDMQTGGVSPRRSTTTANARTTVRCVSQRSSVTAPPTPS
jgi:uncharacterized protein YggE